MLYARIVGFAIWNCLFYVHSCQV